MSNRSIRLPEKLCRSSRYQAWSVLILGILVLIGWQFNIDILKAPIPGLVAMNPMTALTFISCSICFLLSTISKDRNDMICYFIALIPLVVGAIKLTSIFSPFDIGVDKLLFSAKLDVHAIKNLPNRMAPNTAFNFFLTGLALVTLNKEKSGKRIFSQYFALAIAFISLLSVVGYIYSVQAFYGMMSYIPMAIHTAFGFLFISMAILFHHAERGIMRVFTSDLEGSHTARLLIPMAILIPIILGYLRLIGHWKGLFTTEFGVAILVLSIIVVFLGLIWYNSNLLNSRDKFRKNAETKINNLNDVLTQTNSQLENANKELEAFAYSVSHDLRAPLRSVIGYSKMIEEDYQNVLDENGKALLKNVNRNALKMNALIDDLLAFSKLELAELQKTKVNMKQLMINVWFDLTNSMPHSPEVKIGELPLAYADHSLIQQVIINLFSNAIKYSSKKDKPIIEVASEVKATEVIYSVRDNGVGFDMQYVNKLFGVFQRLHRSTDFEGTGVGLAIVQRIVNKHGGKVWAEAMPGQGATFYFALPQPQSSSS